MAGRVEEVAITWSAADLGSVIDRGLHALNVRMGADMRKTVIGDAFGTVGILQKLMLSLMDKSGVDHTQPPGTDVKIDNSDHYNSVAMEYADQLNALYQTFASRVANGIRSRKNSTGIYAHMLAVAMAENDDALIMGLGINTLFQKANTREPRIKKGNLRHILTKIDEIQVDENGKGLILSFDEYKEELSVVDRQLLFYRRYATVRWPWENIIEQVAGTDHAFNGDDEE